MSETILSVDRALDLMLLLYSRGQGIGVSEIARDLDLHKSTVHRILATLENKGFVYKNIETDKYWLGLKIYAMGLLVGEKLSLTDIIRPFAKELFEEFGEVVNVSILDKDPKSIYKSVIILKESKNNKVLSVNPNVGSSSDPNISSVGKCLLAFGENIEIEKFKDVEFNKYTKHTIDNYEDLIIELEDVKQKGYAIDREEQEIGLYCIGAPILDKNGNAMAAISISGPTARMKNKNLDKKIEKLVEVAKKISYELR
ncbi:MAG: IclR family transcriptional regulator [Gudongella sp.]|nr:IclR family transcriptional regulator [Gudongella sp.]